ncbi:choice-of-anchor Q domain-containing protein, partial [uncultured Spirosoma sp.]|uniref:choice-of-anchor Q domain-containing protein n=1 Tax=uncultured Spirosoma sp. TaxID=278208 RepID=UPI00262D49E0
MKVTLYVFLLVCVSMLRLTTAQAQSTHYVKPTATGTGDGSSWTNASADLQAMINASQSGDAVWVAAGVYKPTTTTGPDSRTISFTMKNGVAIYGGFVGTEQNLSDRPAIDPVADQPSSTTLSGEIGDPTSTTDNSLHVLYNPASLSLTASAVLDGFVITGGNASRGGFGINYGNAGGGMYNDNSSPTLTNCLFQSNQATTTSGNGIGGAICNLNSSPILTSCVLQSNSAVGSQVSFGGAIYNAGGSPSLTNCVLRDNQAYGGGAHGGAIYNDQTNIITLTNCRLLNNSATPTDQNSGANGGAIYNDRSTDTRLSSCTLTGNSTIGLANGSNTLRGGAIWASGTFSLTDCLLTDNAITASGNSSNTVYGGALYGGSGTLTLTRCTFRNNAATGSGTTSSNTAYGGAIFNNVSSLLLANCSFLDNVASGSGNSGNTAYGGAIASSGVSLSVSGCSFRNNSVLATGAFNRIGGGAVYMTQGSPILINSSFQNNRASAVTPAGNSVVQNSIFGGAFYNQGSNPSIINCSLLTNTVSVSVAGSPTNNSSTASGGAFYNAQGLSLNSNVRVTNSVLWDNGGSNAIANPGGSLTMTYSLYEPSSVTTGVDVSGLGNLTATTSPFVSSSSVALATGSPAINAGNPASVTVVSGPYSATALPATDLVGNARIVAGRVDMGAVETPCAVPTRLYVASSQTAVSGDGLSWQTAFPDLQTALTYPCSQSLTEIWVAGGTYKPTSTTARDISFAMLPNVKIYGGFVGTEQNLSDRPAVNPVAGQPSSTTLSGEIGDPTSTTDNSLHVLYNPASLSLTASAVLDGFVITGGNASRGGFGINYGNAGGGMYNDNSSPTLTNCLFQSNQATTTSGNGIGGAICNLNSSPILTSCVLQSNSAVGSQVSFGGAIYNAGGSPSLTNCVLRDNQAYGQSANGGAINNAQTGMVTLTNCRLLNNSATTTGLGAGAYGGAIYNDRSTDTRLISCTLTGNSTIDLANGSTIIRGGAIWASGTFSLTDCLLTDNAATGSVALSQNFAYGGALYGGSGTLTLTRCTFRNNAATASGATSSNTAYGGAIFNNASSLLLTNCSFLDNVATGSGGTNNTAFGGAIANFSSLTLTGCSFQNNAVLATGATNRIGGGAVYMAQSSPVLINSSFQNNRASAVTPAGNSTVQNSVFGGAFYNEGSSPSLINCSLLTNTVSVSVAGSPTNNSSTASGGAFYNAQRSGLNSSNVQLVNSVLWDNGGSNAIANPGGSLTMTYSLYEPSSVTTGVDVSGLGNLTATTSPFVSSSSVALATGSPAINAGNPASVTVVSGPYSATALPATDLVGNARIVAGRVDMGAVETPCAVPTRLYVASSQTAVSGDGLSWQTAFPDLQTALTYPCSQSLTEIWVAKGTYKPIYGQGFSMLPNVKIIGGFVGSETAITGRPAINPVNGQPSSSTLTGNGNSVIVNNSNGLTASAVLDGFVITGGNTFNGGAIFNNSSSPTFVNCLLTGNKASYGGAIYSYTSNATFVNCALTGNTAEYLGGAIYISGGSPSLINCSLTGNTASSGSGGAIFNESSSPSLTNCSLTGNTAPSGGAIFNYNSSNPVLTNCSLTNNTAPSGGAIYNESGSPVLTNAVVWNNGGANTFVNNNNSTITAHYSLFDASVTGYTTDPTNLTTTTSPFVSSSSVALATGSPAINAGNPASVTVASGPYSATALPATDLVGNARIVGGRVDMGAVENTCPVPTRLYVAASQTAVVGDGLSWQTAFPDLKSALTYLCSQSLTEIWVAQGTYKPEGQDFFTMLPNVKIIGGFVGNETAITGRPAVNPVNGQPSSSTLSSNGNAIISNYRNGLTATAVLDGFVITGGGGYIGGAIYNNNTSPSFVNCLLTGNKANSGGAIYNAGGSPSLINCALTGNTAEYLGGAIYISGGSPSLINCSLTGNKADYFGGGAIYNENSSNPSLINCSLTGNTAPVGGAIYNTNSGLTLTNAVVWNNGGANTFVNNNNSTITAHYSLFDASVTGYTTDPTNLTTTTSPFVSSTSVALIACAPAINAGAPTSQTAATGPYSVTALPTTDLSGNQRIVGGRVDMGAVEFQGTPNYPVAFTLSPSSGTAVCVGSPVSIPVSVSGTGPVYQWYKDGTVLTGVASATTATLSLPSATTADAGSYSVVVTGACNSLTSTAFSLTVNSPPVPTLTASASSTLTCAAPSLTLIASGGTGGPFSYTFAGPGIVSQQAASGTAVVNAAGVYSVTVTNAVTGCWAST